MATRDTAIDFLVEVYRRAHGQGHVEVDGLIAASAIFQPGDAFIASKRTAIEKCELRGWIKTLPDNKNVKLTFRGIVRAKKLLEVMERLTADAET